MKAKTIQEAKKIAKERSFEKKHRNQTINIIYCNRTKHFYVDTDGLIRLWEQLIGCYVNGVYIAEQSKSQHNTSSTDTKTNVFQTSTRDRKPIGQICMKN